MLDENKKHNEKPEKEERKRNSFKSGIWVFILVILVIIISRMELKTGKTSVPIIGISLGMFGIILNEWFTKKKLVTRLTVITSTIIAVWIVFVLWGDVILKAIFYRAPDDYELTAQEQKLLIDEWPGSEDMIKEGKLYGHQARLLNEIRTGMSYLEEKYPGYKFSINYRDDWAVTIIDYRVTEETTGESFKLRFDKNEGDGLQPEDNFYIYFIEDAYQEHMEEQFKQRLDRGIEIITTMTHTKGREYDISITMDDVISGRLELHPRIAVYISAEGMTEEECTQYVEKEMRTAIEEINLTGTYVLNFFITLEEAENAEIDKEYIYSDVIFWHQKGESDGR